MTGIVPFSRGEAQDMIDVSVAESHSIYHVIVKSLDDLPSASGGFIVLAANTAYHIEGTLDLLGDALVLDENTTLLGDSSELTLLKSTGLATAMINSAYTFPCRFMTITAAIAMDLDATGNDGVMDWIGVNFLDCPVIGTIKGYDNAIFTQCAILNSSNLTYDGAMDTIAWNDSIFVSDGAAGSVHIFAATLTLSRRFRVIYSAVVTLTNDVMFDVIAKAATFLNEGFILDTVAFTVTAGTDLQGIASSDNEALIRASSNTPNSADVATYYMQGNATATAIAIAGTFYKVLGTTSDGTLVAKFTQTDNKALYDGALTSHFKVSVIAAITGGNNKVVAMRIAKNGTTITESQSQSTLNAAGRAEGVGCQVLVELTATDYIEVFITNTTDTTAVTVEDMSLVATVVTQ